METSDEGRPQRLLLHVIKDFTKEEIAAVAKAHLAPTVAVVSNGLSCFPGVTEAGCRHERVVCAKIGLSEELPCFRSVNTVLGNLKTAITGTFHAIRRPYVPRYLAEFQWRFNRRARLAEMLDQILAAAVTTVPRPHAAITQAYAAGAK